VGPGRAALHSLLQPNHPTDESGRHCGCHIDWPFAWIGRAYWLNPVADSVASTRKAALTTSLKFGRRYYSIPDPELRVSCTSRRAAVRRRWQTSCASTSFVFQVQSRSPAPSWPTLPSASTFLFSRPKAHQSARELRRGTVGTTLCILRRAWQISRSRERSSWGGTHSL